jgi:hypothetical protein
MARVWIKGLRESGLETELEGKFATGVDGEETEGDRGDMIGKVGREVEMDTGAWETAEPESEEEGRCLFLEKYIVTGGKLEG